jgi:hypothetical protein
VLVVFLDGVGLGTADPARNPFAAADMPETMQLLGGARLLQATAPFEGPLATLAAVDACLGMPGTPQSATGQAALVTGRNVPQAIGEHYGPKPNPAVARLVRQDNVFQQVIRRGGRAALLNAYPPRYFEGIESGRRLYSSIPLAAVAAGLSLMTADDLKAELALSADFTGLGWASQPGFPPAPIYEAAEAGRRLAELSQLQELSWFDFWLSDLVGHHGSMEEALGLLQSLDAVLGGLAFAWGDREDLVVLTADHGNLEDLAQRGHTRNPVPGLLIGPLELRRRFAAGLTDLTGFAPAILRTIFD